MHALRHATAKERELNSTQMAALLLKIGTSCNTFSCDGKCNSWRTSVEQFTNISSSHNCVSSNYIFLDVTI